MKRFTYIAKSKDGIKREGIIEGENRNEVAEILKKQNLTPIIVKEDKKDFLSRISDFRGASSSEKVVFSKELSTLVSAGIPISQSMNILEEQAESKIMKKAITKIGQDIEGGLSLSNAMAEHTKVFSPFYINMVRAGEIGGSLDETLEKMADEIEKEHELMAKVRGALAYPAVIMVTLIAVVIYMLTSVIPKIAGVFEELGGDLPASTQFLIDLSNFVRANGIVIAVVLLVLVFGSRALIKNNKDIKYIWHTFLLKIPVFGKFSKKVNITRFTRTLSSLLGSGVAVLEALEISSNTLSNEVFKKEIKMAAEKVKGGNNLSETLKKSKIFPTMVTQMISVGEETGTMDDILAKLTSFYEKEVDHTVGNLSSLLEPIIMILMGLGTGFIVISVISPIYQMSNLF